MKPFDFEAAKRGAAVMRDDDYLERQERGEHGDHIADVGKWLPQLSKKK